MVASTHTQLAHAAGCTDELTLSVIAAELSGSRPPSPRQMSALRFDLQTAFISHALTSSGPYES